MKYRFSNCVLDIERHTLTRDDVEVNVEPQVFDLLHLLVRHAGELVSKDQLIEDIWNGRIVSDSTISARINAARTATGDSGRAQSIIKTVTRRGLQFVAPIVVDSEATHPKPEPSTQFEARQTIKYARSKDGTQIAYAVSGSGPKILRAGHFLTHLEFDWSSVIWRPLLNALGTEHTLVRYDQRGTGLSDERLEKTDLNSYVEDLEAVADAAGIVRAPLIAMSQGVPTAIRYAVLQPERVSCLILYGGYAEGRALRDGGEATATAAAALTLMRQGWGKPESAFMTAFTSLFCPDASREQMADLVAMQLASASAENAARTRIAVDRFYVLDQLEHVDVPTLVIHSRNDSVHPLSEGKTLATRIPGANFVVLESNNHIALPENPAWHLLVKETLSFLKRHGGN